MDILHFDFTPPWSSWLRQIMTRLRASSSTTLRERMEKWGDSPLSEIGLALTTKVSTLGAVLRLFNSLMARLDEVLKAKTDQELAELVRGNAAMSIPRPEGDTLPYDILVAVDAFFYEFRSAYEILSQKFLPEFFQHVFGEKLNGDQVLAWLQARGVSTDWARELRRHRVLFFHHTAPWIALQVVSWEPRRFELVVLKKILPSGPEEMIRRQEMEMIYRSFEASFAPLQAFIVERIEAFERAEA